MRCLECNKIIEELNLDAELKLCNYHYGEYIKYLKECVPEQYLFLIKDKKSLK